MKMKILRRVDRFMKAHGFLNGWWQPLVQLLIIPLTALIVILAMRK